MPDSEDGRGDRALAEPGDQRLLESERVDQGGDVVGQQVEADRAAGVRGPAAAARVRRDHSELLGKRVHVAGIGDRHASPDRVGGDHAAVQQHERLALTLVEVVDVDAVGVNAFALRDSWCSSCPPKLGVNRCGQARNRTGGRHRAFA